MALFPVMLLATILSFSFTYGRFSEELGTSGGSYPGNIEYIISEQVEVANMEEFIMAIESGYSNIKISDRADGAIIVTAGVTDVGTDLIINLNGHQLIRNSREPMLNVVDGIRLTIIDTSEAKTGAFYNPVGSVLQISGGTLTVTGGSFESGPREGEYVAGGNSTASGGSFSEQINSDVYVKSDRGYSSAGSFLMPAIIPHVSNISGGSEEGAKYIVNGNMYFDAAPSEYNEFIVEDTFLYYTAVEAGSASSPSAAKGSADFYYRYNVLKSVGSDGTPSYSLTEATSGEDVYEVTVCGYNKVKSSSDFAPDSSDGIMSSSTPYASIRMRSGKMFVNGGTYNSYFGKNSSYGIYAVGGYMAVEDGNFNVVEASAGIYCDYAESADADEYLRISGGEFTSQWGDSICVNGGRLLLGGGNFEKNAVGAPASARGSAVIRVSDGILDGTGNHTSALSFSLTGSDLYGIYAQESVGGGVEISLSNTSFIFNGDSNNVGIYAAGGVIYVNDTAFVIPSAESYGIQAENSESSVSDIRISGCNFKMSGERSSGVSIKGGNVSLDGNDVNKYTLFYIDHIEDCYGVIAGNRPDENMLTSAGITVNVISAQFFMGQGGYINEGVSNAFNGAGVYANADDAVVYIGDGLFITGGSGVSGVYAEAGKIDKIDGDHKTVVITGAIYNQYESGISEFPRGGNDYTVGLFQNGSGIDVFSTDVKNSHGIYAKKSSVTLGDVFVATYSDTSSGILSDGGDVTVTGRLDVVIQTSTNTYGKTVLSSTAVGTQGGDINLNGYSAVLTDSLGIFSSGGSVIATGDLDVYSTRGTAIYVNGGSLNLGSSKLPQTTSVTSSIDGSCSWPDGPGFSDGVLVHGGSLTSYGTFNVTHKGLNNDYQYISEGGGNGDTLYRDFVIKSFAVRVTASDSFRSTVSIQAGAITNSSGGGIYVSQTSDDFPAMVTLGAADGTGPSIITTGSVMYDRNNLSYLDPLYNSNGYITIENAASNWKYKQSVTGGHAVEINGGNLTVYGGSYTANQGEGIIVKNGEANIINGTFRGNDVYEASEGGNLAGPAASYSFKMLGGTVNVYDGTFGSSYSSGNGAFIMGDEERGVYANANIYGGDFIVGGQAGFSIYSYANILFDPGGGTGDIKGGEINVSGDVTAIAIENSDHIAKVTIRGGSFSSTGGNSGSRDGVWYGNANAYLTISGGRFTGSARAGVFFDKWNGASGTITISGGTFIGASKCLNTNSWRLSLDEILAPGYGFKSNNIIYTSGSFYRLGKSCEAVIDS